MTNDPQDDESLQQPPPKEAPPTGQIVRMDEQPQADDATFEAIKSQAGELYEDVHDIFRMAQRSSTLMIKHSLKISHANATRIMEVWWAGCRRKY